jgi:hypothetical protein
VAIFIRTDMAAPPGTASLSTASAYAGSSSTSISLGYANIACSAGAETTILSLSISLSKRSVVVAFASGLMSFSDTYKELRLYIAGSIVARATPPDTNKRLYSLSGYSVLAPGNYTVYFNVYSSTGYGGTMYADPGMPSAVLVVAVVPLE